MGMRTMLPSGKAFKKIIKITCKQAYHFRRNIAAELFILGGRSRSIVLN